MSGSFGGLREIRGTGSGEGNDGGGGVDGAGGNGDELGFGSARTSDGSLSGSAGAEAISGGSRLAPGAGNMVAPGGGNMVAPGGGTMLAPGGAPYASLASRVGSIEGRVRGR